MKITITVDLNDKFVKKIAKQAGMGVTPAEVLKVVPEFLKREIGTENGLLMMIDNIDLFNY